MTERHRLRHQLLRSTPCPYTLRRLLVFLDDMIARDQLRSTRSSCHELFQKHTQGFHRFRHARQRRAQPVRHLQELHELTGGLRTTHIAQTLDTGGIMRHDTIRIHFSTPNRSLCQMIWTRGLLTRDSPSITGLVLDKSFP